MLCPFPWLINLKNSLKLKCQKRFLEDTDEMESEGLPGSGRIPLRALEEEQPGASELPTGRVPCC